MESTYTLLILPRHSEARKSRPWKIVIRPVIIARRVTGGHFAGHISRFAFSTRFPTGDSAALSSVRGETASREEGLPCAFNMHR